MTAPAMDTGIVALGRIYFGADNNSMPSTCDKRRDANAYCYRYRHCDATPGPIQLKGQGKRWGNKYIASQMEGGDLGNVDVNAMGL